MSYQMLEIRQDGAVRIIALNRPKVLNALSVALLSELREALSQAKEDDSVRCLVLTGAGRAFCAGADLSGAGLEGDVQNMLDSYYHPVAQTIVSMPKPVLAAVNGPVAGAGLSLALACDMRLASAGAVFSTAFAGIGLVMDAGSSYFLPRLVGRGRAFELAYSARKVEAKEAVRLGLAEMLLPAEGFHEAVLAVAKRLAQGPTVAYGGIKETINASAQNSLAEQLELEAALQGKASRTADFAEGVAAFAEKRPPRFKAK